MYKEPDKGSIVETIYVSKRTGNNLSRDLLTSIITAIQSFVFVLHDGTAVHVRGT